MSTATVPAISAIICTHSPRPDLLQMALDSLRRQTLSPDRFEVIVVDNGSNPPVRLPTPAPPGARVVREPQIGLNHARRAGIRAARAQLLVLIDDDNVLDPDYLEQALNIARANPHIGAFGGIARGKYQRPVAPWKLPLMVYLGVRDYGPDPITSAEDCWGQWEPIGAGMVFRRDVGLRFVEILQTVPEAQKLDRAGKRGLLSGGDALLARTAYRLEYHCSYQPALKLDHHIKAQRLTIRYLIRMIYGSGRSHVLLQRALGFRCEPIPRDEVFRRFKFRRKREGRIGMMTWWWDWGYYREAAQAARLGPPVMVPAVTLPDAAPSYSTPAGA